ncbi:efflux RND transporter periplasmic adaptor subunit [Methylocystis parvus]|uniref:Efflux RND transporter periplasmic adaptor subunit n=1 Tax=Methylocystis parvus TaxID=134 RepID=A0A6B8M5S2_9HYPH|nr:efflux RND transporter periplasmic adaptor subunit [Methylocystis parvus]QGM97472.1 efflux RND transporter periplasmic adaptor subunit [Methylocystis parvus]WBJ98610.1 efflux RND transporter periplasmic adaptor subunit [Methylocystis parvus OBBP]
MSRAKLAAAAVFAFAALGGGLALWRAKAPAPTAAIHGRGTGPIIYYRDPDGPFYSAEPKKNASGKDYVAVRASEDVSFEDKPPEVAQPQTSGRRIRYYRNPMGLPDVSPVPKKDAMGMDYLPVYEDEAQDASTLTISPGKLQKTGVRSEPIGLRILAAPIRAAGRVDFDPRRTSVVALRFEGFIESVEKVAEGDYVRKGQPLMRVYGPDLSSAAAEYVAVLNAHAASRVEGARRRLVNLGLDDATIIAIAKSRRVPRVIDWPAPQEGHVIERTALSGMRAAPGETLFRIVDHSVVWILADIPERDVEAAAPGQTAMIRARAYPDHPFKGRVALIYPHLNMETRTARVRIELPNPEGRLLGDMFADVEIETGGREKVLAAPESAVIDAGKRQVVILDKGDGRFEPREVKLGRRGEGYAEITSGLSEGDKVVTSANFLIDAESNLKAALQALDQGAPK